MRACRAGSGLGGCFGGGGGGSFHYLIRCSLGLTGSLEGVPIPGVVFDHRNSSGLLGASRTLPVWRAAGEVPADNAEHVAALKGSQDALVTQRCHTELQPGFCAVAEERKQIHWLQAWRTIHLVPYHTETTDVGAGALKAPRFALPM